jgi:hypothetical protein
MIGRFRLSLNRHKEDDQPDARPIRIEDINASSKRSIAGVH